MSEAPGTDLILVPQTGELIDPGDASSCARALEEVKDLQARVREAQRALEAALAAYATRAGERTVELEDGTRFVRDGGPTVGYRAAEVEAGLREAGMPEERIREVVVTKITVEVNGTEARKAARANPDYARVIEAARFEIEKPYRITGLKTPRRQP